MTRYLLVVTLGVILVSCANEVDTTPNKLPSCADENNLTTAQQKACGIEIDLGTCSEEKQQADCGSCIKVGNWYRFTSLEVTSIDGDATHNAIGALNAIWKEDIQKRELNIFSEVIGITEDELIMRTYSGARIPEHGGGCDVAKGKCCPKSDEHNFCVLPGQEIAELKFPRVGCCLAESTPVSMNVYAGTMAQPKSCNPGAALHAIAVEGVKVTWQHSGTCDKPEADSFVASLAGVVSKEGFGNTCSCLSPGNCSDVCAELDPNYEGDTEGNCKGCGPGFQNLVVLVSALGGGEPLSFSCKTPGGDPAVCITANFAQARLEKPPEECK